MFIEGMKDGESVRAKFSIDVNESKTLIRFVLEVDGQVYSATVREKEAVELMLGLCRELLLMS